jgi:hypothetical protein
VSLYLVTSREAGAATLPTGDRGVLRTWRDHAILVLDASVTPKWCKTVSSRKARRTWSMGDGG